MILVMRGCYLINGKFNETLQVKKCGVKFQINETPMKSVVSHRKMMINDVQSRSSRTGSDH